MATFFRDSSDLQVTPSQPSLDSRLNLVSLAERSSHHPQTILGLQKAEFDAIKSDIRLHEGKSKTPYRDTRNILTVGYGFNLERSDAAQILKKANVDKAALLSGKAALTDKQMNDLLNLNLEEAIKGTRQIYPKFDTYSLNVKRVLVDLCFNLGADQLSGFVDFNRFINAGKFRAAGEQLQNTLYYRQVGDRAIRNSFLLQGAEKPSKH